MNIVRRAPEVECACGVVGAGGCVRCCCTLLLPDMPTCHLSMVRVSRMTGIRAAGANVAMKEKKKAIQARLQSAHTHMSTHQRGAAGAAGMRSEGEGGCRLRVFLLLWVAFHLALTGTRACEAGRTHIS